VLVSFSQFSAHLEIDNIREVASAGADTFVAGSAIFNTDNYKATIDEMRAELAKVN
jgi:ribulose-phosphate 3-epimerase